MIRLMEDLRFFIGAFFVIISVLLIGQGILHPQTIGGLDLNLVVGGVFLVFGGGALALALATVRKQG